MFRIVHLLGIAALTLTIVGISETSPSSQSSSETMRRIGVLLFAALYIILVAVTISQWIRHKQIMRYRKQVCHTFKPSVPFNSQVINSSYSLFLSLCRSSLSAHFIASSLPSRRVPSRPPAQAQALTVISPNLTCFLASGRYTWPWI